MENINHKYNYIDTTSSANDIEEYYKNESKIENEKAEPKFKIGDKVSFVNCKNIELVVLNIKRENFVPDGRIMYLLRYSDHNSKLYLDWFYEIELKEYVEK